MNAKLVDAIAQLVQTLPKEERDFLDAKLRQASDRGFPNAAAVLGELGVRWLHDRLALLNIDHD
ncbi:hypothetical protein KR51_00016950 [Rubidibacter lacunae KORDI 51-2]|uniref:Uncharacterized protein n=1 Tax=Rubidibacter lacunae KORDI 51-2 TaxID=582515 RepID=U5DJ42_9CHRO|nr:hypothetical protein [Rubidibacter lacunae]ERN41701.1 hypothetical protein KR51_00016950 [Rubidibacter lacunae KORDI 51-2]